MVRALAANKSDKQVHFYCSSGGNAGLACITAARALGCNATVVVPVTTAPLMIQKLDALGANVQQVGENWAAADRYMREKVMSGDPNAVYVPPFDHPDIWEGAANIVDELLAQMDVDVDGVVCSVGGGGLFNGIVQGIERITWPAQHRPRVLGVETAGADSLNACVRANEHVTLSTITSIATSLGAPRVSERTYNILRDLSEKKDIASAVVTDAEAALACVRFADEARTLVEVACGATVATAWNGMLKKHLKKDHIEWSDHNIVLIVCGGNGVTLDILEKYKQTYG
jgi:L-serine/L-threonine ammonia-lyase